MHNFYPFFRYVECQSCHAWVDWPRFRRLGYCRYISLCRRCYRLAVQP